MKRLLSALTAVVMIMSLVIPGAYAQEKGSTDDLSALGIDTSHGVNVGDIVIRDPFVLVSDGIYYMYGTGASTAAGYGCYVSLDLETWYGPVNVFEAKEGFDGVNCFWAPECHYYKRQVLSPCVIRQCFDRAQGNFGVSLVKPVGTF